MKEEIEKAILHGIVFKPKAERDNDTNSTKVKTKAKKKKYITGTHGSDSAKKKAEIRKRRANRKR
jgi:hypothetical protein